MERVLTTGRVLIIDHAEAANVRVERPVILLVEEDPRLRESISVTLERADYGVITACDTAEALQLLCGLHQIDLVLTDMRTGEGCMSGFELAYEINVQHPRTPVVLMSGVAEDKCVAREHGISFLAKPFTPEAIVLEVRNALARIRPQSEPGGERRTQTG
jgi:DNA-binding NtrC family response regulator